MPARKTAVNLPLLKNLLGPMIVKPPFVKPTILLLPMNSYLMEHLREG